MPMKTQGQIYSVITAHEFIRKVGTFKGVLVGDKELEALEEEVSKVQSDNKAVIYAGIEVNKNENDILTLPP